MPGAGSPLKIPARRAASLLVRFTLIFTLNQTVPCCHRKLNRGDCLRRAHFLFDAQKTVILREPFGTRQRSVLEEIGLPACGEVSRPVVFGFAAPDTEGYFPASAACQAQGVQRACQRADLVHLEK